MADYTRIGEPGLGMMGWGCPDEDNRDGDWLSDGYDTREEAQWAARRALELMGQGLPLDMAAEQASREIDLMGGLPSEWRS